MSDGEFTASQRRRRARRAAHISWANTSDRAARTQPGTQAFLSRFEHQVDGDGVLAPEERAERAQHARQAHMLKLAELSARARRKKQEER